MYEMCNSISLPHVRILWIAPVSFLSVSQLVNNVILNISRTIIFLDKMLFERSTNFNDLVSRRTQELKAGIQNGSIIPLETWELDTDFDGWLSSIYLTVLTVNGTVSIVMHFLVFWLIMKKSPKEMKDYRYFLMNIAVMSFIHDIQFSIYWRPVPFFPIPAAFVQGISYRLGDFGAHIGMVTSIATVTLYITSIICGFVFRLISLLDTVHYKRLMSWYGLISIIIVHAFPTLLLGGMIHFSYVPAEIIKEKALARFPQLSPIIDNEAIFGFDTEYNPLLIYFFLVVLVFIFIVVPAIEIFCIFAILYKLKEMKSVMTKKTYRLHKNLLLALVVQILLPQLMILIPDVFIVFGAWKEWNHVNIITEVTLMLCTCHSVIDNFVMIFMITPYRKAFKKLISNMSLGKYKINIVISKNPTTVVPTSQTTSRGSAINTTSSASHT